MKAETAPRVGAIDALATGLSLAARHPWLLVIPVLVDLGEWLAPRLSVETLLQQARVVWEALLTAFYTGTQRAAMAESLALLREGFDELGRQVDLMTALTTGWLAPPSAMVDVQMTRFKLISDGVLAPVGMGLNLPSPASPPWQTSAIEFPSVWLALLVVVALWIVGQLLTTVYLRAAAAALTVENTVPAQRGLPAQTQASDETSGPTGHAAAGRRLPLGFGALFLRLAALSLLLGIAVYLIRLPLAMAMALAAISGNALAAGVFVLSGGLTLWFMLWFLSAVFFASEAILFEGQTLGPALWQALILARTSGWRAFGLIVLINLIALGFRAVWGLIGQTPLGVIVSILGNAYLATGLLLAIFIYYSGLRREFQALRMSRRPLIK